MVVNFGSNFARGHTRPFKTVTMNQNTLVKWNADINLQESVQDVYMVHLIIAVIIALIRIQTQTSVFWTTNRRPVTTQLWVVWPVYSIELCLSVNSIRWNFYYFCHNVSFSKTYSMFLNLQYSLHQGRRSTLNFSTISQAVFLEMSIKLKI